MVNRLITQQRYFGCGAWPNQEWERGYGCKRLEEFVRVMQLVGDWGSAAYCGDMWEGSADLRGPSRASPRPLSKREGSGRVRELGEFNTEFH